MASVRLLTGRLLGIEPDFFFLFSLIKLLCECTSFTTPIEIIRFQHVMGHKGKLMR